MICRTYGPEKSGEIRYGFAETPFGRCLVAGCHEGICEIFFTGGSDAEAVEELRTRWSAATQNDRWLEDILKPNDRDIPTAGTRNQCKSWFTDSGDYRLCPKGTPFQMEVWSALMTIPFGQTVTYSEIAQRIGRPEAVRAVATAIAANKIALLIPCHRVIRRDGSRSGYRWGCDRKAEIIEWESSESIPTKKDI